MRFKNNILFMCNGNNQNYELKMYRIFYVSYYLYSLSLFEFF